MLADRGGGLPGVGSLIGGADPDGSAAILGIIGYPPGFRECAFPELGRVCGILMFECGRSCSCMIAMI